VAPVVLVVHVRVPLVPVRRPVAVADPLEVAGVRADRNERQLVVDVAMLKN
jgi:hypothetical protein